MKREIKDGQPPRALQLELEEAFYLMRIGRLEIFMMSRSETTIGTKKSFDIDEILQRVHSSSARLLVLTGLPGSGKTTFSKALQNCDKGGRDSAWVRLSQDEEGTLPRTKSLVRWGLGSLWRVVVDRCNSTVKQRIQWIRMGKKAGLRTDQIACVHFRADKESCVSRIRNRGAHPTLNVSLRGEDDKVSKVVSNFAETFESPDESKETFGEIFRVEVKKEEESEKSKVIMSSKKLDLIECWNLFSKFRSNFVTMYAAYYHYRDMGWVPKPGYSTGSDFVLYTKHPAYVHASFTVHIVDSESDSYCWSWIQMASRVTHGIRKVTLMCEVVLPDIDLFDDDGDVLKRICHIETETNVEVITLRRALTEQDDEEDKVLVDGKKH